MSGTLTRNPPKAVLWGKLVWHPAVRAWNAFTGDAPEPERLEVLRKGTKAATYRLVGAGPGGESIIAQRSPAARAVIERAVNEDILSRLALTAPRYHGYSEDGRDFVWLFYEDVGDEHFCETDPAHPVLAARWVGSLHAGAAGIAAARNLPDRGPPWYLDHLRVGRDAIRANRHNPALLLADTTMLAHLVVDLDALEAAWSGIERACTGIPATLTHGDIQRKNMYVRSAARGGGAELFFIDWEMAGWGVPAPDLTLVDLPTYVSAVRPSWPGVRLEDVQRLAAVGRIFRQVAGIRWVSPALAHPDAQCLIRPMAWLRVLHERLVAALHELGALT
ncbi:MAG TPA: phosphotransferase [Gemmatimonadales bacterium]|nr:phosphotransferase [Gemmatimonadales bacterium]